MCDMTPSYVWHVWHDSFICVTQLRMAISWEASAFIHMWVHLFTCEHVQVHVKEWPFWVMSHIWRSHVTHVIESWRTYEGVRAHMWMSHVTHMNESCHTCEWVMSHIWRSHVTHVNESWRTYEWVRAHMWTSHFAHMSESCHTYAWLMLQAPFDVNGSWVMSHVLTSHVSCMSESYHT